MIKHYKALRRVSRLDYLFVVVRNADIGYKRENALSDIQKIQADLESNKAKALGKKKARPVSGKAVLTESEKMALQLRYVHRSAGSFIPTPDGEKLLYAAIGKRPGHLTNELKAMLTARFWQVYPKFGQTIMAISSQTNGTMELPTPTDLGFVDAIRDHYDFECEAVSFKIIREISSELGLLNWHIFENSKEKEHSHLQRVYAIVCIAGLKTLEISTLQPLDTEIFSDHCTERLVRKVSILADMKGELQNTQGWSDKFVWVNEDSNCFIFSGINGLYIVAPYREIEIDKFEECLWVTYLDIVKNHPLFPVIYPVLRNEVCYRLRITDEAYDQFVEELIKTPRRIRVYPSSGILDYSWDLAHLHKHLPPQNEFGKFMTFLKISRL